jgi:hypothetical protein
MDPGDGQDDLEKRRALVPVGIRIPDHPYHSVVTAPTELSRLPNNCGDQSDTERDV